MVFKFWRRFSLLLLFAVDWKFDSGDGDDCENICDLVAGIWGSHFMLILVGGVPQVVV